MLAAARDPYLVLLGPPALARALAARLPEPPFAALGEIFAPGAVDLGRGRAELGGLRRGDVAIRDRHPALWLARVRARAAGLGVPVLPLVAGRPAPAARRGPARPGGAGRSRCRRAPATRRATATRCSRPASAPAACGRRRCRSGCRPSSCAPPCSTSAPPTAPTSRSGWSPGWRRAAPPTCAPPTWCWPGAASPGATAAARRRAELAAGLAACRFRDAAWFPALAAALAAAYDPAAGVAPGAGPAAALEVVR